MSEYRINVYESPSMESEIIARVRCNAKLDSWNGSNWCCGGTGFHKGITKLKNGKYVIIETSDWQNMKNFAYIVSEKEALQEILRSENQELLDTIKFKPLKKIMEANFCKEEE
ncbi:MAG: hypothetical protein ACRCX2_00935 [Paraclostridium sp.]